MNLERRFFENDFIQQFLNTFRSALTKVINGEELAIKTFSVINSESYDQIIYNWNNTAKSYPDDKTVVDLFREQAATKPHNIAIVFEEENLTYQQLNELSDKLAKALKHNYSIAANTIVGILLTRSEKTIIAMLGILKAGAAYVFIDPEYPQSNKKYIVEDTALNLLVTQTDHIFDLDFYSGDLYAIDVQLNTDDSPDQLSDVIIKPNDLAYVIYTSGSTGTPKGV